MIDDILTFTGLNCTINTTEDCNLRCKYCYETNKRPVSITFDKCRKFIDLVLSEPNVCHISDPVIENFSKGRVFDFIGGDSLIDPGLLDRILCYINYKWALLDQSLFPLGWRASISSNGTLFEREDVRAFCEKWRNNLSLGISIDGCPEIHDKNRVFPNGKGSMEAILKWWPWYQKTFPDDCTRTKATCARETIPYLFESLKFLHEELGLTHIHQNFIMEDTGCTEEDYKELDRQLEKCCGYCLDHRTEIFWSMLSKSFVPEEVPDRADFFTKGHCGSGAMPCLSIDGKIYPCFRWLPHTQNGQIGIMATGDVDQGFTHIENFQTVTDSAIRANCTKDPKCWDCEYEPCCHYCIGGCYAEYGDFIRTTHICEITKLQCKWARIYWKEFKRLEEGA